MSIFGDILSFAGGIASGLTGSSAKDRELANQREFAQNGIRWRVQDAKAAGLHPLAALGTNITSYSPQAAVGTDFGLGQLGQDISRAAEAKATKGERAELDQLQKDLLRAQINNVNADTSAKRESVASMALQALSFNRDLNAQTQLPPAMPRSRGISNMDGISGDINLNSGKVNLASHINPEKAYEVYEVPFHGSQLPLPTDETSNMMEGLSGEVQYNMRRFEDAVSKGDDTYYDFTTGTYRHNKVLHNIQKFLLNLTPQKIIETHERLIKKLSKTPKGLTNWEKQLLNQTNEVTRLDY